MRPERIKSILFLQKAEVLPSQQTLVIEAIKRRLPGARVTACGSAEDVPGGASFDAVIAPTLAWLPQALSRLERYDWIHFLSAGVEKIWDMPFEKTGVLLTKSSGVHGAPMSEFAMGAMLYFAKSFDRFVQQSTDRKWERHWLDELTDRKLTILGMGSIGSALAERARVFGMDVVGVRRSATGGVGWPEVIGFGQLGARLAQTDYLVVCLPLTDETAGSVDADLLRQLKQGAVLVDISRGGVVSESAVLDALDRCSLRGAALDVFEDEPLPAESRLWAHPRVLLTPHVSGTAPRYMERAIDIFLRNAASLAESGQAVTPVDPVRRY
jgi:phosphoglycerate dehydrogenase-like enzyme